MKKLLIAIASFIAFTACNTTGCLDNRSSIPIIQFYSSNEDVAISVDSIAIGGVGAPGDSLIVSPTTGTKEVYLPLRSFENSTSFFIAYCWKGMNDTFNDTITFDYQSLPYFASEECGAMYLYTINKVSYTTHLIDSVVMLDTLITNSLIPTVRIYYQTQTTGEQ